VKYLNKTSSVSLFHCVKCPTVYPNLFGAYSFTFCEICEKKCQASLSRVAAEILENCELHIGLNA